jgi:hypothetical protein
MSSGQKRRTPEHFPRMKRRGWQRKRVFIPIPYGSGGVMVWPVRRKDAEASWAQAWRDEPYGRIVWAARWKR